MSRNVSSNEDSLNRTYHNVVGCDASFRKLELDLAQNFTALNSKQSSDCAEYVRLSQLSAVERNIIESGSDYADSLTEVFKALDEEVRQRIEYDNEFLQAKAKKLLHFGTQAFGLAADRYYQELLLRTDVGDTINCLLNSSKTDAKCRGLSIPALLEQASKHTVAPLQRRYVQFAQRSVGAKKKVEGFMTTLYRWSQTSGAQLLGGVPTFDTQKHLGFIESYSSSNKMKLGAKFAQEVAQIEKLIEVSLACRVSLVDDSLRRVKDKLTQVQTGLAHFYESAAIWREAEKDRLRILVTMLDSYEPPAISLERSQEHIRKASTHFQSSLEAALETIGNAYNATLARGAGFASSLRRDGARVAHHLPQIISLEDVMKPADLNLEFYAVSVKEVQRAWSKVVNVVVAGDVLLRLAQTLALVNKYWKASAVMAPLYDTRTVIGAKRKAWSSVTQKVALLITHPAFLPSCAMLLGIVIGTLLALLYAPLYASYVQGCVTSKGDGTVFTRNWSALLVDYAGRKGGRKINKVHRSYKAWVDAVCSQRVQDTTAQSDMFNEEARLYQEHLVQLRKQIQRLHSCFDHTEEDSKLLLRLNTTCSLDVLTILLPVRTHFACLKLQPNRNTGHFQL